MAIANRYNQLLVSAIINSISIGKETEMRRDSWCYRVDLAESKQEPSCLDSSLLTHSFSPFLLSTYYMHVIVPAARDSTMKKTFLLQATSVKRELLIH